QVGAAGIVLVAGHAELAFAPRPLLLVDGAEGGVGGLRGVGSGRGRVCRRCRQRQGGGQGERKRERAVESDAVQGGVPGWIRPMLPATGKRAGVAKVPGQWLARSRRQPRWRMSKYKL